jgi:hypothetical protein
VIDVGIDKSAWACAMQGTVLWPIAALAMAKGVPGDYCVTRPIAHLNGIAARMLDAE